LSSEPPGELGAAATSATSQHDPSRSRENVVRNGAYLIARETAGLLVRSLGLVLLVRTIGADAYGVYAGPLVIVGFLAAASTCGTDLFLLRRGADDERWFSVAYAWLLTSSVTVALVCVGLAQLVKPHLSDPRFVPVFQVLVLSLPVNVLWVPGKCRLERSMAFVKIAIVEVAGDITLYGVSLPLAYLGLEQWAAVGGYVAWQSVLLVLSVALAGHRPRLYWSIPWFRQMLGFGSTAAAGTVLDRARDAAIPLIVGHFGGASGIGVVTLAMRLVDTMGFARRATWRLAVVAVGWLHTEPARLRRALQESTALQVLAVGPILAVFAVVSPWLVPGLFGSRWGELVDIFPYFALAQLAASLFTMHGSTLLAIGNARAVALSNLTRIVLVVAGAVALGPRYGIPGASAAVAISILGFAPLHAALRRFVPVTYRAAVPLLVMFVPLICAPLAPPHYTPLFAIPLAVCFAVPSARRDFITTLRVVVTAFTKRRARRHAGHGAGTSAARPTTVRRADSGPDVTGSSAARSAAAGDAAAPAEPSARGEVPLLLLDAPQQPSDGRLDAEPARAAGSPRHRRHR
jgi:PST family polysaccharide transporter